MPRHPSGAGGFRFTRVRALLAGGLVLGLGATMTLAAWTDSEYGQGTFTASKFDIVSRSGTDAFAQHATTPAAVMRFNATGMSPGVSAFTNFDIQTTPDTTVAGTVGPPSTSAVTASGTLIPALEYRMIAAPTATTTCAAAAFVAGSTYLAGTGTSYAAVTTAPATITSELPAAGSTVRYCFEVRIQPNAAGTYGGTSGVVTWAFTGTSSP